MTSCQKSRVIDRIAQPNVVKCVSATITDRESEATTTMWANCANHLVAELKILRPELVVFHGVNARWAVLAAIQIDNLTSIGNVDDSHGHSLFFDWPALGTRLLFLSHPSHGWLDKQWDTVVVRALEYLRGKGLIPG